MNEKNMDRRSSNKHKCLGCEKLVLPDSTYCRKCVKQTPQYLEKQSKRIYKKRINKCVDCNVKIGLRAKRCQRCRSKGENNAQWKGGTNPLKNRIRKIYEYRQWRSDVYTRDNFTCITCGSKGNQLNAHHIVPFNVLIRRYKISSIDEAIKCSALWDINNGMTLCKQCHSDLHKERGLK